MSRLADMRKRRDISQVRMAQALGISRATYQELEAPDQDNPRLRYLINAAIILRCDPFELIEEEWFSWKAFGPDTRFSPEPEDLWRNKADLQALRERRLI